MKKESPATIPPLDTGNICFGLDRETDERSLIVFIERFAAPALLGTLIPRLDDAELTAILDFLSRLMHKHISEAEYHRLFLRD